MISDVFPRFRHSLGDVTFPDLEDHMAVPAIASKLLRSFVNMEKVTEFHPALSVHLAGCRHD